MKFETLKKNQTKKIVIGLVVVLAIAIVGILSTSKAKYRHTQSIPLVRGIISGNPFDFQILGMYKQIESCTEDSCYEEVEIMPDDKYKINQDKSFCYVDSEDNHDTNVVLKTVNGKHGFDGMSQKEKCYIYFDNVSAKVILANITINDSKPDFSKVATTDEGVFKIVDDTGKDSYYFRGAVTNNYLTFANKCWRIIRINGDGTIRIIYDGTTCHVNGANSDSIAVASKAFNTTGNNAIYSGFKYKSNIQHGIESKSNVLKELETWYTTNLEGYASYIDVNAGFCGDRTAYSDAAGTTTSTGVGTSAQYFADYIRLQENKNPTLTCDNSDDLYTMSSANRGNKSLAYPIGLINANEVAVAGGVYYTQNKSYYVYNGQGYWTMSPANVSSSNASAYFVGGSGGIGNGTVTTSYGIRPVINLRADAAITGKGIQNDPYVVS